MLEHAEYFTDGVYPPEPTSYTDIGLPRLSRNASFVLPKDLWAELNRRLDRCGQDGEWVRRVYADGWDLLVLAKTLWVAEWAVIRRIKLCMMYCRGRDARDASYKSFCAYERSLKRLRRES